jgi:hypothetical protein
MNGKKDKRKMKEPINVATRINMKKTTKLNMNMMKKVNTMLQVDR